MSSTTEGLPAAPQSPPRIPGFTRLSSKVYNLKYSLLDNTSPTAVMTKQQELQSNLDIDYVISYDFTKTGTTASLK
jgi:hypothetical protein